MRMSISRRGFLSATTAAAAASLVDSNRAALAADNSARPRLGLVTYNWGREWDLPTLIRNCETTGFAGVELRSTHGHGVEITLPARQRAEVRARFENSSVELVGLGSACEFHSTDPAVVRENIIQTKAFVRLCRDVGGSGVKVRPNGLPQEVPVEKTAEQIGRSLNEVARYAADHGALIRLEVHGWGTSELPLIKQIMDVADHPAAVVCWNCNPTDLNGAGLEHNFRLVQNRINIVHIHDLRNDRYPWKPLFRLLWNAEFRGWTLLEEGRVPDEIAPAMHENRELFNALVAGAAD